MRYNIEIRTVCQSGVSRAKSGRRGNLTGTRLGVGWLAGLFCLLIGWVGVAQVQGQGGRYPLPGYYAMWGQDSPLQMGEFRAAERAVQNLYRSGYREGNQRWVDSTAYLSLLGEIRYQAGDYLGAMQAFDEALEIYASVIHWPARVSWDAQAVQVNNSAVQVARVSWGTPTRNAVIGRFPSSFPVRFGQDIIVPGDRGNTVIPQERLVPVDVLEIYRAMALVIRRRDQILGTISQVDAPARLMRSQLNEVRAAIPAAIPATMGSILYGIALTGEGEYQRSSDLLRQHLQINGLDHPLTPVALLQIGYNQYLMGQYRAAKATLAEASYSAAYFTQFDVFRESLVLASRAHMAVNRDEPLPELDAAFEWARVRGLRVAQAQFAMAAGENAIENGLLSLATQKLSVAGGLMRTNDMKRGVMAARLNVLEQAVAAINGSVGDLRPLRAALVQYRPATPWAFQIEMLTNPARRRNLTTSTLTTLIERILRDPTQTDWDRDPFECLAYLTGDRSRFMADALAIQFSKNDFQGGLIAAEHLRRVQFYSQLPLGGRLLSIRELLTRSPDELSPELRRRQAELRARFADFKQLLDSAEALTVRLQNAPIQPEGEQQREWEAAVEQWSQLSGAIERQLIQVTVRREAIPLLFPPPVDLERVQNMIPPNSLCLIIVPLGNVNHVLLVSNDRVVHQSALSNVNVGRALRNLAKSWGHTNSSAVLQPQVVSDQTWRRQAHSLLMAMIPLSTPEFWDSFDELVVVPGGLFWYLPFECLAVDDQEDGPLLIDKVAIRYAPSLGLAFSELRPKRLDRVISYPGKIDIRDDDLWVAEGRNALDRVWPATVPVESSKFSTEVIGPLADAMIYWNDIRQSLWPAPWTVADSKRDFHLRLDLDRWIRFPIVGPKLLVVAGGNSAMADGFRGNPDGSELAYYSTLLLASGCQSAVLPRWRCGGHVAYDFQVALAKNVQKFPTAIAMQKTIQEIRQLPLDPQRQTRLRSGRGSVPETADHPFWWAGQMVIDRGAWYRDPADQVPLVGGDNQLQLGGEPPVEEQVDDQLGIDHEEADQQREQGQNEQGGGEQGGGEQGGGEQGGGGGPGGGDPDRK